MNEPQPRRSIWGRFLLIWALILLQLGAAACVVLYKYLEIYEITRPEPVMDAFIQESDVESITRQARENLSFQVTEFEDAETLYSSYIDAIDTSRTLSYHFDSKASTDDHLVYTIRSGPSTLCSVVMTPDGPSPGFNRNQWQISELRSAVITDILPSVSVVVDALSGQEFSLNGKNVSEEYITDVRTIDNLTRFEAEAENPPQYNAYEIGPLYGDVQVSDAHGNLLSPDETAADTVHYQLFSGTRSLTVRAPEDMEVRINGVPLKAKDAASSTLGVLEGLDLYTMGSACYTNDYHIDNLYMPPVVTAREPDGREVTPIIAAENSFTFFHSGEPETEEQMRPVAEIFFNAYMDYSAHAFEPTRFYNLLNRTLPRSSLYEYIYNSQEAMYWASGTSTEYKDLIYENFHRINDYCFVCTVIYSADMTATNWYEQYSYQLENAYELAFVSENGRWLAAGMNVITAA